LPPNAPAFALSPSRRVDVHGFDPEPRAQLVRPLLAQRRRHDDEHPGGRLTSETLGDDEPGFNRLAETDVVGNEHAPRAMQDRQRRFELMRQDSNVCIDGARECPDAGGATDEMRQARERMLPAPAPEPIGPPDRRGSIERREKGQMAIAIGDVEADDVPVALHALDAPAALSDPDQVAREWQGVHDLRSPCARAIAEIAIFGRFGPISDARGGGGGKGCARCAKKTSGVFLRKT